MKYKLIACEVFVREVCLAVATTPNVVDIEFTPKGAHDKAKYLQNLIQNKIDDTESEQKDYNAILLGYGLCGNGVIGLEAKETPLVIPRAHDCCTIFLGSRKKFTEHFGDRLSAEWTSAGYLERGEKYLREAEIEDILGRDRSYQDLVEQYGEENARYVWQTIHPDTKNDNVIFIEVPEFAHLDYASRVKEEAEKVGKEFEKIKGDMRRLKELVAGDWDQNDFLIVQPGQQVEPVYDHDKVIMSQDKE